MHIAIISGSYPSSAKPIAVPFVQQIVRAMACLQARCSVISPVSVFSRRFGKLPEVISYDQSIPGNSIKVIRHKYFSFSVKDLYFFNTAIFTQKNFNKAVQHSLVYLDCPADVYYGHFLYQGGQAAVAAAQKAKKPSVVSVGEGTFWSVKPFGFERAQREFEGADGFIAVSSVIKRKLKEMLNIPDEKIVVLPNGVDLSLFFPRSREEVRAKYGIPTDKFIIAFVGNFDELKGPDRLLKATNDMEDVGLLFIGKGNMVLESPQILFKGQVDHTKVPEMLCASDIFVLPTVEEGSCNSLLEAMACGVPIVTSNAEFNDDLLNDEVAIRVNTMDILQVREAILKLKSDSSLRLYLSQNAITRSKKFDINVRAKRILEWSSSLI